MKIKTKIVEIEEKLSNDTFTNLNNSQNIKLDLSIFIIKLKKEWKTLKQYFLEF